MFPRRSVALALASGLFALGLAASSAVAAINVQVNNVAGVPIEGARAEVRDASGNFVSSETTDVVGGFVVTDSEQTGHPAPFSMSVSYGDSCRDFSDRTRRATRGQLGADDTLQLNLDVRAFCASPVAPSGLPAASGLVDAERAQVVLPRGGRVYLNLVRASGLGDSALTLDDGSVVGGPVNNDPATGQYQIVAPDRSYAGGLNLRYQLGVSTVSRAIGTLIVDPSRAPATGSTNLDLVNVIDISGSMASNDPNFRRKDAVGLVLDLSRTGDRVGAVGFDSSAETIFGLTRITGRSVVSRLRRRANTGIINRGGTDYDVGLRAAFAQLASSPDSARPKAAIFLTDGAHNGAYDNTHLKFVANGTGRAWPICVVKLGRSFASADVARLKRIAKETGGLYVAAPSNTKLTDLYFRCRGRTAGELDGGAARTRLNPRQVKSFRQKVTSGLAELTVFASWDRGTVDLGVRPPGGPIYTASRRPKAFGFRRGSRYAFFRIPNPKAGTWRIYVGARNTVGAVSLRTSARRRTAIVRRGGPALTPPPGRQFVTCAGKRATIVGSDAADVIIGTPRQDVIQAGGGSDRVSGLGGNDIICLGAGELDRGSGGAGNDIIWGNQPVSNAASGDVNATLKLPDGVNRMFGGTGNDRMWGAAGPDTIVGGPGRDYGSGGVGNDRLFGNGGNDTLKGFDGDDLLSGGPQLDTLHGENGDDVMSGDSGNDRMFGQAGDDRLSGGPGHDVLRGNQGSDRLVGGSGNDRIDADLTGPYGRDLPGGDDVAFGGSGNDTIWGGKGNDRLSGGGGRDDIRGESGADVIRTGDALLPRERNTRAVRDRADGGEGDDLIVAGDGNDYLVGGQGSDRVFGGPGADRIIGGAFRCSEGAAGADRLFGQAGNDSIDGCGWDDRISGGPGNDSLHGNAGNDVILGGPGNDRLVGDRDGNIFGAGRDVLRGEGGNDWLRIRYYADAALGGPGNDFIVSVGASVGVNLSYPVDHPIRAKHSISGGPGTRDKCQGSKSLIETISGCEIGLRSK